MCWNTWSLNYKPSSHTSILLDPAQAVLVCDVLCMGAGREEWEMKLSDEWHLKGAPQKILKIASN